MLNTIMSYSSSDTALAGVGAGMMIFYLLIGLVMLVAEWKIFVKAGEPGWACIIPIYSAFVLFKIVYGNGIKFLLVLIPVVGQVVAIMAIVRLCQRFGKGVGFILGMIFLSPIFICILGFDKSYYQGPDTNSLI